MSRTKQASLGRRLGRLEAMLKSVSDREPTYEEFHAARGRIGALVALEAVDGMLAEARQAEEARRYTPYPPAMLEWCREELQLRAQAMESNDPGQQARDNQLFERYCALHSHDAPEERERAKDLYFNTAQFIDEMERSDSIIYQENYQMIQDEANKGDAGAQMIVDHVAWVRQVKEWLAQQRNDAGVSETNPTTATTDDTSTVAGSTGLAPAAGSTLEEEGMAENG